jgi:arsenate reductase
VVIEAMHERDIDLSDRTPRAVTDAELAECDIVATMGCSTLSLPEGVEARDWALADPHGQDIERVREIREEIEGLVRDLFDEVEADLAAGQ